MQKDPYQVLAAQLNRYIGEKCPVCGKTIKTLYDIVSATFHGKGKPPLCCGKECYSKISNS